MDDNGQQPERDTSSCFPIQQADAGPLIGLERYAKRLFPETFYQNLTRNEFRKLNP